VFLPCSVSHGTSYMGHIKIIATVVSYHQYFLRKFPGIGITAAPLHNGTSSF
jgi:hypothetical protein